MRTRELVARYNRASLRAETWRASNPAGAAIRAAERAYEVERKLGALVNARLRAWRLTGRPWLFDLFRPVGGLR